MSVPKFIQQCKECGSIDFPFHDKTCSGRINQWTREIKVRKLLPKIITCLCCGKELQKMAGEIYCSRCSLHVRQFRKEIVTLERKIRILQGEVDGREI